MPPKLDPWRDRPSAGQSGSTSASAAFAFAVEPPQPAQQTPTKHGATPHPVPSTYSSVPQPSNQSSATSIPTKNEDGKDPTTAAGAVADQIDQLEDEVVHFMNLSMVEKEKSEVLSGRLESVTQEKEDLERQVDELDQELSRADWQGQDDGASATDAGDTISRVNAKITKLRTTAQQLDSDLQNLTTTSEQQTKTIAELEEQLRVAREQLAQKTEEEERLHKELEQANAGLKSEKKTNEEIRGIMRSIVQERNELRASNDQTKKKLMGAKQTANTLSSQFNRKVAELDGVQKAGAAQADSTRQELDRKQKEIETLKAAQKALEARCAEAENALQERPLVRSKRVGTPPSTTAEAARPLREKLEEKDEQIKKLAQEIHRNQMRRVRAVAIGIDLSGSAAGSLTEGIKKMYAHLLEELKRSPCQTYVMTVVHGPGDTAVVKSKFGDTWETHEKVLEGKDADGMEQHVACLRKIKEVAISTGLVLDLQVVLLGDSNTNSSSHVGAQEVCHDFACSNPTVHIHTVAVKTGTPEEAEKYWKNLEAWHPWNYASGTGGNMLVWWQNSPLPDLSSLVY